MLPCSVRLTDFLTTQCGSVLLCLERAQLTAVFASVCYFSVAKVSMPRGLRVGVLSLTERAQKMRPLR